MPELKEIFYTFINAHGEIAMASKEPKGIPIELEVFDEFRPGTECYQLEERANAAIDRLQERLGAGELYDEDVKELLYTVSEIQRILCYKMFDYGEMAERLKKQCGIEEGAKDSDSVQ